MKLLEYITKLMSDSKIYWGIFLISFLIYMFWNQNIAITDPVESNYALTSKEMVLSSDWISPRIYGNVWFDKPIFFYWLTSLSFQFWGFSNWAARLAPAIFASIGLVLIYWFVSKILTHRLALLAVVIMGTSFEYIVLSKLVITDMVFFVFNCAVLCFFYLGYVEMNGTNMWYLIAYISMALAVLTKGPIGVLLPALVILLFIILQKKWMKLKKAYLFSGFLIFGVVAFPWYAAMYALHGMDFINGFLGVHNYLRATVSEHPKDNVIYYYFVVFILSMLPWSALSIKALFQGYREWRVKKASLQLFLLLWIIIYFAFYSLIATKYLTYTFPIIFPVVIFTAIQLEKILINGRLKDGLYWIGIPFMVLLSCYMIGAYHYLSGWKLVVTLIFLIFFLVYSALKIRHRSATEAFKIFCLCQVGLYIVFSLFVFPAIAKTRSGEEIAKNIIAFSAEKVGMYQFYSTSAVFYSEKLAIKLVPLRDDSVSQVTKLDWSSKYTMPTQEVNEFWVEPLIANCLIIVKDKQKKQFLMNVKRFNYQLLKEDEGVSYYFIKE